MQNACIDPHPDLYLHERVQVELPKLQAAISIACRLGFATRLPNANEGACAGRMLACHQPKTRDAGPACPAYVPWAPPPAAPSSHNACGASLAEQRWVHPCVCATS